MSRHPTRTRRERAARRYYLRWAGRARAGHGSYRVGPAVLDRLAAPRERRLIREMDAALARVESLEADWHACRDAFHMAGQWHTVWRRSLSAALRINEPSEEYRP